MNRRETRQAIKGAFLKIEPQDNNEKYTVHNISRGGLRFSSQKTFEIDERINISVYLTGDKTHQAKGRICYFVINNETSDGNYYGVSFLDNFLKMD